MKRLITLFAAMLVMAASHAAFMAVPLGTFKVKLFSRPLDISAMIEDGELSYVKIECPTSAYSTGDIIIMADALPSFVEGLNKMDAAMNAFKRKVHEKNYSNVKTEITGFPNVSYRWDVGQHLQQNAPFEFTVEVDDRGNFKSSIVRQARDDDNSDFVADFYLPFDSLYNIQYIALLLSNDNIQLSIKKQELLLKMK